MKTSFNMKAAAALALMMASSAAVAGSIVNTKHNLGMSTSTGISNRTAGNFNTATTEICVFCHTPHGADSAAAVPLWNRSIGSGVTYNTYASLGTASLDTKQAPIGSVSLACLSCHDGTQAMNVVINSPGSNSTQDINTNVNGPGTGTWNEFGTMSDVPTEMIYLSTDLRNDHPISIQYAGGTNAGNRIDPDFKFATKTTANGQDFWYVEAGGAVAGGMAATGAGYQKEDFKLYARNEATSAADSNGGAISGGNQPYVECATCHDPHVQAKTFLRMGNNNGSQVCLTCHTK